MTTQGPQGAGAPGGGDTPPTEEELQAALEEQMRRLTVPDVLVQTVITLVNLGARKLGLTGEPGAAGDDPGVGERDLEEARLAIEGTRAILPLLPGDLGQIREALSQLQMIYARAAGTGAGAPEAGEAPGPGGAPATAGGPRQPPPPPAPAPAEDPARAAARSRIWTPRGD